MNQKLSSLCVLGALIALGSPVALAAPDWSKVPTKNVPVIHPGVSPVEWVQSRDHSGASGLKKGETCAGCHNDGGHVICGYFQCHGVGAMLLGQGLRLGEVAGSDADLVACGGELLDEAGAHVAGTDDENFHGDFLEGVGPALQAWTQLY